tara:strand:+ start:5357 stop:5557 length:201 start_codon:yes stop_codon:yes gene_type:complete
MKKFRNSTNLIIADESKSIDDAHLLVPENLKGINEASGQEYDLIYADKVEYDENGENPILYYKMIL